MLNRRSLAQPAVLVLFLSGCSHEADQAMARQATRPGVYAVTPSGLVELPEYGTYALDAISQEIHFNFRHPATDVTAPLGFVTNLPGVPIADAKIFLLPSIDGGRWHKVFIDANDSKPIASSADVISPSVYKVIPADIPKGAAGFLCLWVKMPPGTDDRMYAVHLK